MVYRIYTVLQAPAVLNPLLQAGAFLAILQPERLLN